MRDKSINNPVSLDDLAANIAVAITASHEQFNEQWVKGQLLAFAKQIKRECGVHFVEYD